MLAEKPAATLDDSLPNHQDKKHLQAYESVLEQNQKVHLDAHDQVRAPSRLASKVLYRSNIAHRIHQLRLATASVVEYATYHATFSTPLYFSYCVKLGEMIHTTIGQ
jgi:hypothetical protein